MIVFTASLCAGCLIGLALGRTLRTRARRRRAERIQVITFRGTSA